MTFPTGMVKSNRLPHSQTDIKALERERQEIQSTLNVRKAFTISSNRKKRNMF